MRGWQELASKLAGIELTLSLNVSNTTRSTRFFKGNLAKISPRPPRPYAQSVRNSFLDNDMDHDASPPNPLADSGNTPPDAANIKIHEYESSDLLRGAKEVLIHHGGETYRLRLTRNDKLILQK